jgi:hypothetical protein
MSAGVVTAFDSHPVVWDLYFRADKDRVSVLRGCAAWVSVRPAEVTP